MEHRAQCAELCSRRGLELLGFRESLSGASRWIAHVRDKTGASFLLKQTIPQRGASEAAALRAWNVTGSAARLMEELGDGAYLAEWLDGVSLAELPLTELADFASVGRMLRSLHAIAPPQTLDDIRNRFTESVMARWHDLTPEMMVFADEAATRLRRHEPRDPVMLHGDLVPSNVMMTGGGPRIIDPYPCEGLAAWDIAQLAAAAAGRGRRGVIAPLLEGYGSAPSLLPEMYAWMLLSFLQSNLAAQRVEFSDNLRPLALELVRIGDPSEFLRRQCAVG
jgi:Ser/Thr protein kinase RdoA (MazF antagonist)